MLKIFNTLGKELQEFESVNEKKALIYQCGPTVYWVQHIGNMRAMVMGDLVSRTLMYLGYEVELTRNYTDVGHLTDDGDEGEDKMEKGAKREKVTPQQIAAKYIQQFEDDVASLNVIDPAHKPKATDFVGQMIDMTQTLLEKGFAYATPVAIYFDTSKAEDYTRLSGQKLEFLEEGAGHGDVQDSSKKHPSDFALWFFKTGKHKNAIQTWDSPFSSPEVSNGEGFPGWHIECSAMAKATLGDTIDIHLGGIEHIPVHHTNEIAQSEHANGVEFAHYWLHNEHLTVDSEKMSKSDGNVYTIANIVDRGYDPIVLRYFFLGAHYRSKQNFTWEAMDSAATAYSRLLERLQSLYSELDNPNPLPDAINPECKQRFIDAIGDDFNIPAGLAVVWDMLKDEQLSAEAKLAGAFDFDRVLGLMLESKTTNPHTIQDELPAAAIKLLEQREKARAAKDWTLSDSLRDELSEKFGVQVKDTANGQTIVPT